MLFFLSIVVLIISSGVYLFSACPTVLWNDSGELITAVHSLGMAHSPSFPFYVLLAKCFTFLPLGAIAFKVNLISAIFGWLTILVLFHVVLEIVNISSKAMRLEEVTELKTESLLRMNSWKYYIPAIAASFILAFTHAFWLQSVRAEIYTLSTFLACLLIYFLLKSRAMKWRDGSKTGGKDCIFYLIALIYGLALSNHSLLTIYLSPAIVLILIVDRGSFRITPKCLAISFLFVLLGLSLYLYLPIRSIHNPVMDWNDPESFWKFINAFSRKRELGKFFEYSAPLERIEAYVYMMIKEFTFFIYWIGIVGIWQLCKRNMPLAVFTAFIFMLNTLGTVSSSAFSTENPDILGYLTISYLIYAIWIGVGFKFLTDLLSLKGTKAWNMVATFFLLGILISPLIVFLSHFSQSNKSNNYYARDYGTNIIRSIEDNSIFLLRDDNTNFILEYLIHCERLREDIRLFDQDGSWNRIFILQKRESYPELSIPSIEKLRSIQKRYRWMTTSIEDYRIHQLPQWGFKVLEKIIFENLTNYRLYWEFGEYDAIVEDRLIPNGLIFRISETREVSLTDTILKQHKALWNVEEMILWEDKEFLKDRDATKAFSFSLYYLGNYFRKRGMFLEASNYFENSIQLSPHKPQAINNLGYCYLQMNRLDEAEKQFLTMLELFGYYEKAHLNLGVVYAKRGEYAKAKSQWELVLKRNPDSPIAKENLEKLLNLSRKDM